jgi:crotonobetainyl-CoA:carnitine CoA-transferase CaiB-like acyl-CoA transferase
MFLADLGADVVRADDGHAAWSRNKRIGSIDDPDVIVCSGTDFARMRERSAADPRCIVLHVPPFLGIERWAGDIESEGLLDAWMGVALRQTSFEGGPIDHICPVVTTIQGVWAATCAVAALIERERSGLGQIVTVSGEHGAMVASAGAMTFRRSDLDVVRRHGGPGGSVPFYRTYRCGDGEWLFFGALIPNFTRIGFEVLGLSHLFGDPRLEGRGRAAMLAPDHAPWVTATIAERFAEAPRDEWIAKLRAAGCPAGAILERDDWLDHPQVAAIGMREEADGVVRPGISLRLASGSSGESVAPSGAGEGPLAGVRVLDLGAIIAGPFSASLLGELGADVIKVEPLAGDSFRGPGFAAYNKGQRSIALDLRHDDGRAVFQGLVHTADVVIDNYRPGVLARLGIDHASLVRTNEAVISASITGFGDGGPFGEDAGFDPVLQAMSGMMKAQGGSSDPVFYTCPVNDVAASSVIAFGCTVALFDRLRRGRANKVTTSLAAMATFLQTEALLRAEGRPPAPVGSRDHPGPSALDRFYACTDGSIRIDARDPSCFAALDIDVTEDAIAAWTAARSRDEAVAELTRAGIAAIAARTMAEIADDPEMYDLDILQRDPRPDRDGSTAGRHAIFTRTTRRDVLISPALGAHTYEVLAELGYDAARIEALLDGGGVGAQREAVVG